ncbi:polysaccharide deacetylase family protein [Carnobacterium divergens]|uniref:polysaccharide deacetylase family protein n=1 Tax=Carnobacterium divergens TaxID=2748 RepID=UPI0007F341E4|nr:polysaccharide deacetylase family protein [Carnobacterium divergens]SBO18103.1 Polysaccharide deacetylase family protein (modular protein) [Carnobacterium divergens]
MGMYEKLVGVGLIVASGLYGLSLIGNASQKIDYPNEGMRFFEPKTVNQLEQQQLNKYMDRKVEEQKKIPHLKDYLREPCSYFLNIKKIQQGTASLSYRITEIEPTLNPYSVSFKKRTEMNTITTKEGTELELQIIFTDANNGVDSLKQDIIKKINEMQVYSTEQKQEIIQQITDQIKPTLNHYSMSDDLFEFELKDTTIQVPKAELKRVIKPDYLSSQLNQQVADEIQQEKIAEQKRIQEEVRRHQAKNPIAKVSGKVVALTFDDGPSPTVTPRVLELLKKYNAKATFFVLGKNAIANPSLIQQEILNGNEIGNHSWNHADLTKLKKDGALSQIQQTNQAVKQASGYDVQLVRPPYGAITKELSPIIGMPVIQWSVDSLDWKTKNGVAVHKEVMSHVKNGSIVLMHDIHPTTADGLEQILKELKEQGYQFVTISELFGTPMVPGKAYYND